MPRPWLRTLCSSRSLVAAAAVGLAVAGPAAAVTGGSTVVVGTSGTDVINEHGKPGSFRLWGLGGFNALAGGAGDNQLVGNGHCPPDHAGTTGADDASHRWDDYCSTDAIPGAPGAILDGGGGINTIYGSGGQNLIVAGPDQPSAGYGNMIFGGPAGDLIIATRGSSLIYPGAGHNVVDTRGAGDDSVICQPGDTGTVVYADRRDQVHNCSRVVFHAPGWSAAQRANPSLTRSTLARAAALLRGEPVHRRSRHALDRAGRS